MDACRPVEFLSKIIFRVSNANNIYIYKNLYQFFLYQLTVTYNTGIR